MSWPVIESILAEPGASSVHVNRVLRRLREKGMVTFRNGFVSFDNYDKVTAFAAFDPTYLDQIGPLLR